MNNLKTDYDVRLATLKKLGGDMTKKYATIYDVDLAILEKTGQGGGGGGDVELKTFGGKSLKGQGEFLDDYSGIPNQGDVLGVTEQLYRPEHFEQQISYPEEFQNAYSYKFIEFYNNNAYNMPTPEFFILYVKKTQEDFGTIILYDINGDSPMNVYQCPEDFTDMKTYQINGLMFFYNSNSVFQLSVLYEETIEFQYEKLDVDTAEETFKNFIQWLRTHNFNKQILTQNSTTIISDDSGNLYKIPSDDFSIPQPVSFTNFADGLQCNTDNMYYMYHNNGIIYNRGGDILYCSDDNVAEFKVLDSFVGIDDTPKIYQYFELQLSENESSYSYHLVSPNNGKCYFIYKTYSEEGVENVSLREGSSPYALSGFDLASEVDGYINSEIGIILHTGNFLTKYYILDFLYDYKLGFTFKEDGTPEWQVYNIAEQKATEKIEEFKNSGYIENVATAKATEKVDSELYNITTHVSELNVKDYAENDLNDESLSVVNATVPYSGSSTVSLNADFTNGVWSSEQTVDHHKSLYRIVYNGNRVFEVGVYRKEDGNIAPSVSCRDGAAEYFEPGSTINITDVSGNSFVITDPSSLSSYKLDQLGLTGKHIYINFQVNSNISLTSIDFEISTGAMRKWTGGVDNSNLFISGETTTKTAKYATKEELNGKADSSALLPIEGRIDSVEQSVENKVDNSSIWSGSQAEWDALPVDVQNSIKIALITE